MQRRGWDGPPSKHPPGRFQQSPFGRGETWDLMTFGERLWDHAE
jgi:hypothetical protein